MRKRPGQARAGGRGGGGNEEEVVVVVLGLLNRWVLDIDIDIDINTNISKEEEEEVLGLLGINIDTNIAKEEEVVVTEVVLGHWLGEWEPGINTNTDITKEEAVEVEELVLVLAVWQAGSIPRIRRGAGASGTGADIIYDDECCLLKYGILFVGDKVFDEEIN
ncbi:hypothetical protein PPACK8108_LOCUS11233 [Phakopsora pachyrhizi]|uniref:Uncharacterized protein n=1 Tax=Phakopsora pachyrhizi TaxID=170000 RepID=A0AAV0B064_PHAPC|nr:hypothetical protein PPACK8108_LOCUS11233 [Phakopsora pachyrhizi]